MAKRHAPPELVKRLLEKDAAERKNPKFSTVFLKEQFKKHGKTASVRVLWDLYHSYLPAQAQLNQFFEIIKNKVRDVDAKLYEKIKGLRPSAGEYSIFADVIDTNVRRLIERRVFRDAGTGVEDYWKYRASIPRDLTPDDVRVGELSGRRTIKVEITNEVFYAPFDQDDIVKKLKEAYAGEIGNNIEVAAVHEALQGRVQVYQDKRDYKYYNKFAERLQTNKALRREGNNDVFVDWSSRQLRFKEKQVDVSLAVRAMELLYAENISYIAVVASDIDFLPVFRQFAHREQPYFLIHIRPVHSDKPDRSVAYGYRHDPAFDRSRVINVEMADLANDVFKRISTMLTDRALGSFVEYEDEFEENWLIYEVFEKLGYDEYKRAERANQQAFEDHMWELYNEIGHHEH